MKGRAPRKPQEGDRITHNPGWRDEPVVGVVDWIGSKQFAYVEDDGRRHMCLFVEDWKEANK